MHLNRNLVLRMGQLVGIAAVAVVVVATLGPKDRSTAFQPTGRPMPLPSTQLAATTDEEFGRMIVGLKGTPVVMNVWASWCPPCRAEMPLLERAAQEYEGRVAFVGVASQDSPRAAGDFLDEVGVTYPNLFDASGDIGRALGQRGFPTTYVFDRDGVLRETVVGGITEPKLAAQLEDLLR